MTNEARIHSGKKIASLVNGIWKIGQYMQKNQTGLLPYTTNNNKFQTERFKHKTWSHKTPRRKQMQ